jgi:hypothetical protein
MKGRELNRLKRNQWERTGTKIGTKRDYEVYRLSR